MRRPPEASTIRAAPAAAVLAAALASLGSTAVASLALANAGPAWGVLLFYTLPAVFFVAWATHEFSPSAWRRSSHAFARTTRRLRLRLLAVPTGDDSWPAGLDHDRSGTAAQPRRSALVRFETGALRPWLQMMRFFIDAWRSPRIRRIVSIGFGLGTLALFALVVRRFGSVGWPLAHARPALVAAAGALFLSTFAFKALGWQQLFRPSERPRSLKLAAASGFAALAGIALPGRFDDAVRVAVVQRLPGRGPAIATLALSLFLLGLMDTVALTPLATAAAAASSTTIGTRIGLAVVAGGGAGAAVLLWALPRLARTGGVQRFRLGRWAARHVPSSQRALWQSAFLVLGSWATRSAGIFVLLHAFGLGYSFPLALAYLAGGAASGALPLGPAGAATQAGVGAAVLTTAGVSASAAIAFAIAAQVLTVLAGAAIVLFALGVHGGVLVRRRPGRDVAS